LEILWSLDLGPWIFTRAARGIQAALKVCFAPFLSAVGSAKLAEHACFPEEDGNGKDQEERKSADHRR